MFKGQADKSCVCWVVGGLCVGIFSPLQGWLCVGVLCALQCAKNSEGSGRQSHGCLNVCRMSFRVTYNNIICNTSIKNSLVFIGCYVNKVIMCADGFHVELKIPFLSGPAVPSCCRDDNHIEH